MPKVYHETPPFRDWLQEHGLGLNLNLKSVDAHWWSMNPPRLEIRRGDQVLAEVYKRTVYLYDRSLEQQITSLAIDYERLFSDHDYKVEIEIHCQFPKTAEK